MECAHSTLEANAIPIDGHHLSRRPYSKSVVVCKVIGWQTEAEDTRAYRVCTLEAGLIPTDGYHTNRRSGRKSMVCKVAKVGSDRFQEWGLLSRMGVGMDCWWGV